MEVEDGRGPLEKGGDIDTKKLFWYGKNYLITITIIMIIITFCILMLLAL